MDQPVVLGIVSYKVFPAQMGGQKYIVDYYTELSRHIKIVLAVSKDNQVDKYTNYKIHPILFNHWYGWLNMVHVYRLCQIIRKEKVNVIMINHSYFGWLGLLLKKITGKKLAIKSANIESLRFRDMHRPGWRIYGQYEGWVHRHADINFFISTEEKQWAIDKWNLIPGTCATLPYGTKTIHPVSGEEKLNSRRVILKEHNLSPNTKLFFFNGTLDYLPNTDALYVIVQELLHRMEASHIPFCIFICGSNVSEAWAQVLQKTPNIIYKGFVPDINRYYRGTDCLICPVTLGTGVKTKIVEALAQGQAVIACKRSGSGMDAAALGKQLILINDYDWNAFAEAMLNLDIHEPICTPYAFYAKYNWPAIVEESILSLQQ
ncbi:MAG TPA: glycosyltransferase family 4 protein [Sediminibacterium sp.]|nr:glycosyltransferase family 4 protein [Sediminibacterium sp.]